MKSVINIDIYRDLLKKVLSILLISVVSILAIEGILASSDFREVFVIFAIFGTIYFLSITIGRWKREKKRVLDLIKNKYFDNKKVCCVLFDHELSPRITRGDLFSGITFFQKLETVSNEYLMKEVGNTIICPLPAFNSFLSNVAHGQVELLIISNDGFKKNSVFKDYVLNLVDDFLQNGANVGYYRKEIRGKNSQSDIESEILKKPVTIIKNLDALIDFVEMDDNSDEYSGIIISLRKLIKSDGNSLKYEYMNSILSQISNQLEESDMFYQILKLIEYFFVYRGLYFWIHGEKDITLTDSFEMSIGKAEQSQEEKIIFYEQEVVSAYKQIYSILNKNSFNKKKVTYNEICNIFVRLRNDYIGHGTMAFSVSTDLLKAMMILLKELIVVFSNESIVLTENDVVGNDVKAVRTSKNGNLSLFWSYRVLPETYIEYYDFNNAIIESDQKDRFDLDWSGVADG